MLVHTSSATLVSLPFGKPLNHPSLAHVSLDLLQRMCMAVGYVNYYVQFVFDHKPIMNKHIYIRTYKHRPQTKDLTSAHCGCGIGNKLYQLQLQLLLVIVP